MEITLAGAGAYKVEGWTGQVEVEAFQMFQYKRIANARNEVSLFRKLVKTFKSAQTPIQLPKELDPKDLLLNDFFQIIVACWACHERGVDKVFTCGKCGKANPRHIDILKVFIPSAPKYLGGIKTLPVEVETDSKTPPAVITCRPLTIGKYLEVNAYLDNLFLIAKPGDMATKVLPELRARYGEVYEFADEEDAEDFRDILYDFGMLAIATDYKDMDFEALVRWMFKMDAGDIELYKKIDDAVIGLSPDLSTTYKDKCGNCGKEISADISPAEYFFGMR